MSSPLTRLASGYRYRIPKAGLGNVLLGGSRGRSGGGKLVSTTSVSYATPGMPKMPDWDADWASRGLYLMNGYVMRCVRLRADTIAGLPYRAGVDPTMPGQYNPAAPLAKLLGAATVMSPGGPNPTTSARAFWAWSIVQKIVTGRWAWEMVRDEGDNNRVFELWPLVSRCIFPVPSSEDTRKAKQTRPADERMQVANTAWWDGFKYETPMGYEDLKSEEVFYAWRPSILDWREPESDLQAARVAVQLVVGIERYMWGLMKNQMVARKLIVTPPFDESENRRAFEESFLSEFTGYDNAGKTIFAEVENEYDETGKVSDKANIQVVDLATKGIDAQMREVSGDAKRDVNIALGVPLSLLGDASQRTYANSDSEYRNFWTITVVNDISEVQDPVNVNLAPLVGNEVGWFDLSQVAAVQPPQLFQPPAIKDAMDLGLVTAEQASILLGIPRLTATGIDVETAPLGEELAEGAGMMERSIRIQRRGIQTQHAGFRDGWLNAPEGWRWVYRSANTYTLKLGLTGFGLMRLPKEQIRLNEGLRAPGMSDRALELHTSVARIRRRRELGLRAAAGKLIASGLAVKAHDTGRVLMLQRSDKDPTDPHGGMWEFPGGHIEPGEDSYDAAAREWCEETGCRLPEGDIAGSWTSPNGIYRGHVLVVPSEAHVPINLDPSKRKVLNPDDPDGDDIETAAWWHPKHLTADNPAVRREVRKSHDTWAPIVRSARMAKRSMEPGTPMIVPEAPMIEVTDDADLERFAEALTVSMGGA